MHEHQGQPPECCCCCCHCVQLVHPLASSPSIQLARLLLLPPPPPLLLLLLLLMMISMASGILWPFHHAHAHALALLGHEALTEQLPKCPWRLLLLLLLLHAPYASSGRSTTRTPMDWHCDIRHLTTPRSDMPGMSGAFT
jgi:hypothetical protein